MRDISDLIPNRSLDIVANPEHYATEPREGATYNEVTRQIDAIATILLSRRDIAERRRNILRRFRDTHQGNAARLSKEGTIAG
jgi:hypothetical protein